MLCVVCVMFVLCVVFCLASSRHVSTRFVSSRLVLFRFVSFCPVSFRFVSSQKMHRNETAKPFTEGTTFDLIVVGSGNGACGFLSECLENVPTDYNVLVLEQGQNFFYTSEVTHQNGWSQTYSSGSIFRLHNTLTSKGRPILSGRAVTMGGGGSINYTMIHESSNWLAEHVGKDSQYWDGLKYELNKKLNRPDPFKIQTCFAEFIQCKAIHSDDDSQVPYAGPKPEHMIQNIPSLQDNFKDYPSKEAKQLYIFPTQFDAFGARTGSGVSIVDWDKVYLRNCREVTGLVMDGSACTKVKAINTKTNKSEEYALKPNGRVVLASGSQSPRLLMRTSELTNEKIGRSVNDHICMPLAIYSVPKERKEVVGPTDNYESIFGTLLINPEEGDDGKKSLVTLDFFSGDIERLLYLVSSLYICYLPFNSIKRLMNRFPFIFTILSNGLRILLKVLIFFYDLIFGIINVITFKPWGTTAVITTALVKFSCVTDGQYEMDNERITLNFFEDERDFDIAEEAIKKNLDLLESLGEKPNFILRAIFRFLTKIPYDKSQVKRYVRHFSKKTLLSEQHLAGGCLFGDVIDKGLNDAAQTGKVFGSKNIYVADLSAVPIPRVSTQMTAYLIGFHVGKQLYAAQSK